VYSRDSSESFCPLTKFNHIKINVLYLTILFIKANFSSEYIEKFLSQSGKLDCGAPRGYLGPLIFLVDVNTMPMGII